MTDTREFSMQVQHAVDAADHAMLAAQEAEHRLQRAITTANPSEIQSAQAALVQAKHKVNDAHAQLEVYNNEQYGQQIKQTMEQLIQASQDLDANHVKFHTPKQIR
ncbi:hypothetical protein ACFPES_13105 [Paenibacillus sp. GCM10023248]|uniref:hypothetical protein n=1 Tax=Bacillales TaxID=1385 RepID=UPI002379ABF7|nr:MULTISPECIES: hypothetical protein [Bacillales]MDD9267969.1 hypothetical protein [Paenibacillus sp. MAHUQ-63]MDR6882402.1 cellobiose-specific phosphotransferase system component IIA [Bacillus sp. 3255]